MALRRPMVFGNWKMNGRREEALALTRGIMAARGQDRGTLGIFPPATVLSAVAATVAAEVGRSEHAIIVGGQDCHADASGAHTGSLSPELLADAGATAVIIGHSERRQGHAETDDMIRAKAVGARRAGLLCVVCIGETEAELLAGGRDTRLVEQIDRSVPDEMPGDSFMIAYEPVWAIGTGRTPQGAEVSSAHALIRRRLAQRWSDGAVIPILYGGSVNPGNAAELLRLDGVDGALVGGASLDVASFIAIRDSAAG